MEKGCVFSLWYGSCPYVSVIFLYDGLKTGGLAKSWAAQVFNAPCADTIVDKCVSSKFHRASGMRNDTVQIPGTMGGTKAQK